MALWDKISDNWHWWACPKQLKLRASYGRQMALERECLDAIARDR